MNKKKELILLIFLVFLLFTINYRFLDNKLAQFLEESEFGVVERVIDGDTAIINGNSTRLLGINTPERGEKYYQEAKELLSNLTLNKTVKLEYIGDKYDKYGRTLAYILIGEKNINLELVRNGLGNTYIYNNDKYTNRLEKAWNECIAKEVNLCEKSNDGCADCVQLKELNVKNQTVVLYNNCSFNCNLNGWSIKDEGRKKFVFQNFILKSEKEVKIIVGNKTNTENVLFWRGEDYVWTSTGDTLFLRDERGKLILFKNY